MKRSHLAAFAAFSVFTFGIVQTSRAYDPPPSWMPMTMLNVTLSGNQLAVQTQPITPVLKFAASGTFDPSTVWGVLNSTAYSRRLGWYDPINDDFYATNSLPVGDNVYITELSQTANGIAKPAGSVVQTYFVSEANNPNGPYTPIFGTAGSSTTWQWDGKMDHNAVAVSAADITVPNELFTATYQVFIGSAPGVPDSNYLPATTTWTWQGPASVPEPTTATVLGAIASMLLVRRKRGVR